MRAEVAADRQHCCAPSFLEADTAALNLIKQSDANGLQDVLACQLSFQGGNA
jgi:hypothetical protein